MSHISYFPQVRHIRPFIQTSKLPSIGATWDAYNIAGIGQGLLEGGAGTALDVGGAATLPEGGAGVIPIAFGTPLAAHGFYVAGNGANHLAQNLFMSGEEGGGGNNGSTSAASSPSPGDTSQ